MFRKIITYFLILAVVLPVFAGAIPLPIGGQILGAKTSFAQETLTSDDKDKLEKVKSKLTEESSSEGEVIEMCDFIWGKGTFVGCAMWVFVDWFLYKVVLKLSVLAASIAGTMFNISIGFSLTGSIFDANKNIMIRDGWTYVRDLLNLVFIFILLYSAISTILQYGGFEIKKVLPSLIVAALLVNFSMMIAKMVIDASHIFAWEFYNQIKVDATADPDVKTANIEDEIKVLEIHGAFEKKNLANVFLAGFNPQKMLTGDSKNHSAFAGAMKKAREDGNEVKIFSLMTQMMIILVLQSALALFGGFVLLAGAIMFVLRVVVLWLVMIFSPLAFLGMILPNMGKYSKMWWGYLIGQSFFAPAFLFMFMLVTKFISSSFIDSIIGVTENSNLNIAFGLNAAVIIIPIFHFMIVGGLMMMCLIVARQLGGKTAEFGISWAHKGKDLALGTANKFGWRPTRYGLRYGGGAAGDSDWWAKSIGRIPGGGMLGRKLGAMRKADEDKARKAAEKYAGTLSGAGRESLEREIEGTKGVAGFAKRFIYTGPEGAFKPGKEGYEKIIEKKKGEDEKKEKIKRETTELEMTNQAMPFLAEIKENSAKQIKILEEKLDNIDTDIKALDYELERAVQKNKRLDIDRLKQNINNKKKERVEIVIKKEQEKEKIIQVEKSESDKEKLEEKMERRKETEGLQEAIKTSGSGGGASKSGGGKTTP